MVELVTEAAVPVGDQSTGYAKEEYRLEVGRWAEEWEGWGRKGAVGTTLAGGELRTKVRRRKHGQGLSVDQSVSNHNNSTQGR